MMVTDAIGGGGKSVKRAIQAIVGLLCLVFSVHAIADSAASQVFEKVAPSVVEVLSLDTTGKPHALGSGVVIAHNEVATNCHVLDGGAAYKVRSQGKDYTARIRYRDRQRDICSLVVRGLKAPPVSLGNTASLKVGDPVYAVGTPEGLELTLSQGIISSLRDVGGGRYIQTTAAISHGSSGGGLFDSQGRLLGLTSFYIDGGQQLNFALPVEWIKALPQRATQQAAKRQSQIKWLVVADPFFSKHDWPGLLALSQRWVKVQPNNAKAWRYLGYAYLNTRQYSKAIDAYRQALRIDPKIMGAWNNLGLAYNDTRQYSKAIDALRQALRIDPKIMGAWFNLGVAYNNTRQYSKAIDAFRQALRIDPKIMGAWNNLGVAYNNTRQYSKAIDAFRQALRIDPKIMGAWNNLGVAYNNTRQYSKAIDAFRQALRINPKNAFAWNYLGLAYEDTRQYSKAIDAYRQSLRINSKNANAWFLLGLAYSVNGQNGQVINVYERLKVLSPKLADKLFNIAIAPK